MFVTKRLEMGLTLEPLSQIRARLGDTDHMQMTKHVRYKKIRNGAYFRASIAN
ncbi:hypothetical protein HpEKB34_04350 [Helicobacter pylori]